jgi:hypothetical protein
MKRRSILIESESLDLLRAIKAATGLSESEQMRRAIRLWLETREWPLRSETATPSTELAPQKVLRKS